MRFLQKRDTTGRTSPTTTEPSETNTSLDHLAHRSRLDLNGRPASNPHGVARLQCMQGILSLSPCAVGGSRTSPSVSIRRGSPLRHRYTRDCRQKRPEHTTPTRRRLRRHKCGRIFQRSRNRRPRLVQRQRPVRAFRRARARRLPLGVSSTRSQAYWLWSNSVDYVADGGSFTVTSCGINSRQPNGPRRCDWIPRTLPRSFPEVLPGPSRRLS